MSKGRSLQPIPLSRARTAYGLLRDVQRVILAEPKRVNMKTYAVDPEKEGYSNRPACGTVGCFAGWVVVLSKGRQVALNGGGDEAGKLLGWDLHYELPGNGYHVFNAGSGDQCARTLPGSKAHARAVYNRINGFIQRNLKALKARKLVAAKNGTLSPAPGQD